MGCDAHPIIEVMGPRSGKWRYKESKSGWYHKRRQNGWSYDELEERRPSYINVLGTRNYWLFGLLADVRNGMGFTPLFPHRGVPDDADTKTKKMIEDDGDLHSLTYFTLQELIDIPWDQPCVEMDIAVFADEYSHWKETGDLPDRNDHANHAKFVFVRSEKAKEMHREVTENEMTLLLLSTPMKKLVKTVKGRHGDDVKCGAWTRMTVPRSHEQMFPQLKEIIPDLQALGSPDRVRVVLGFDN